MTPKPDRKEGFIIFAFARSGSTTLHHILNLHPEINMAFEPFNKGMSMEGKGYYFEVKDEKSLYQVLGKIYSKHQGIKHLNNQLSEKHNKLMLKRNYKIIFLWRKNYLQKTISHIISRNAKVWFNERERIFQHKFAPLQVEEVHTYLNIYKDRLNNYYGYLTDNQIDFFPLTYEELYDPALPVSQKLDKINEVFEYLGYGKVTEKAVIKQAESYLDPENSKLNNELTYFKIPNIVEIEKIIGSKENGHLFVPGFKKPRHYNLRAFWIGFSMMTSALIRDLGQLAHRVAGNVGVFLKKHSPILYHFLKNKM